MRFCTMNFGKKIVMTTKLRRLLLGRDGRTADGQAKKYPHPPGEPAGGADSSD